MMKTFFILLVAFWLTACGNDSGPVGTYHLTKNPDSTITFKDKETLVLFGSLSKKTSTYKYEKKGNVISFNTDLGTWTLTQLDDGSLLMNGIEKYEKK